jgi:hypothetical protein
LPNDVAHGRGVTICQILNIAFLRDLFLGDIEVKSWQFFLDKNILHLPVFQSRCKTVKWIFKVN